MMGILYDMHGQQLHIFLTFTPCPLQADGPLKWEGKPLRWAVVYNVGVRPVSLLSTIWLIREKLGRDVLYNLC